MTRALELATHGATLGEIPVGAVVVKNGEVLGEGHNTSIATCDPSAHAEVVALRMAGEAEKNYRLPGTTLYTTLEPCAMCAGALLQARVKRLVFAAHDPRAGAVESVFSLLNSEKLNHRIQWIGGISAFTASEKLHAFFRARRRHSGK